MIALVEWQIKECVEMNALQGLANWFERAIANVRNE